MSGNSEKKQWGSLILFIAACLGVGFLGSGVTAKAIPEWYAFLNKPAGNPPNWIFGPVWTVLYIFMGISVWRIWSLRARVPVTRELTMFGIQLSLNALWSPIFFGMRHPGLGLLVLMVLWRMIFRTYKAFKKLDPVASHFLLPYLAWVTYAGYLNAGIWWLNR